jgi:hypothetical protein
MAGDVLVITNYAGGFHFGAPKAGTHGGLHPEDSRAVLAYGFPGVDEAGAVTLRATVIDAIQRRCGAEGGRQPSTADLVTGLLAVL